MRSVEPKTCPTCGKSFVPLEPFREKAHCNSYCEIGLPYDVSKDVFMSGKRMEDLIEILRSSHSEKKPEADSAGGKKD